MHRGRTITMLAPFALVSIVHLVALATGASLLSDFTKPILMVLLFVAFLFLLPRVQGEVAILALLAILLSWLGDVALTSPGTLGYLIGLGLFLCAHIAYATVFFHRLRVHRFRPIAVVYLLGWVLLIAVLAGHLGTLLIPVMVYGLALCGMAALALHCNRWIAAGGALFVVSDTLLGLRHFVPGFSLWQADFLIMLSYLVAQGLIAFGVLRWVWAQHPRDAARVASQERVAL